MTELNLYVSRDMKKLLADAARLAGVPVDQLATEILKDALKRERGAPNG